MKTVWPSWRSVGQPSSGCVRRSCQECVWRIVCAFEPSERSQILGEVAVDSASVSGARVVDPTPWLCYQGECPIVIGGLLSYRDTDHITTEYAANLWAELGTALHMLPTTLE